MKVGVVGVGAMGQNHARVLSEEADLIAVVDATPEVGLQVARRFRTKYLHDVEQLIALAPDALTVATPTASHFTVVSKVLEAGIPVLVEKPFCGNTEEAAALVQLAERRGVLLAAGMVERHNPAVEYVRSNILKGEYGAVITMASRRVSNFPSRVKDIGVVMDLGIHDVDVMRHLLGREVRGVYAQAGRRRHESYEDHANLLLEFQGDTIGTVEVNWLTPVKVRKLSLTCEASFVEIDYAGQRVDTWEAKMGEVDPANLFGVPYEHHVRSIQVRREEPLVREMRNFLHAAAGKGSPLVSGADALRSLAIVEAAAESHRSGRRVDLDGNGFAQT